jgi:MFS family permease
MITEKAPSAPRLIPSTRFTLAILVSFALFVQYAQRVGLSMAIVCMVDRSNMNIESKPTLYPGQIYNKTVTISTKYGSALLNDKKFLWSEFQQQILLGAYWFGYIFTLLLSNFQKSSIRLFIFVLFEIGGWLSVRFGAKQIFTGSLLLSSIATLGMCCIYFMDTFSFYLALLFRMVIGFMHGSLFPASYTVWSQWAVTAERSTLTSIGFCGNNLGTCKSIFVLIFLFSY